MVCATIILPLITSLYLHTFLAPTPNISHVSKKPSVLQWESGTQKPRCDCQVCSQPLRHYCFYQFPTYKVVKQICVNVHTYVHLHRSISVSVCPYMSHAVGSHQYLQFSPSPTEFFCPSPYLYLSFLIMRNLALVIFYFYLFIQSLVCKQLPDNISCPLSHIAVDTDLLRVLPSPVKCAQSTSGLDSQESPPQPWSQPVIYRYS